MYVATLFALRVGARCPICRKLASYRGEMRRGRRGKGVRGGGGGGGRGESRGGGGEEGKGVR